ncbi:MAG: hypothetical protein QGH33_06245 [Pirellulaceae bacterium]|jgi:hypothetical protein|nr:hypothetical protein [Pirellulaceae bacterium]HJN12301.1 hypothetical protein [Pirellulaceae bacterium]
MHPLEKIELPVRLENDLDDVPPMGRRMAGQAFSVIHEHGEWKTAAATSVLFSFAPSACCEMIFRIAGWARI